MGLVGVGDAVAADAARLAVHYNVDFENVLFGICKYTTIFILIKSTLHRKIDVTFVFLIGFEIFLMCFKEEI